MEIGDAPPPAAEPAPEPEPKEAAPPEPDKDKKAKKGGKPKRDYLGWEAANDIEWRTHMEFTSKKKWAQKYGPGTEWNCRYEEWIRSGMRRGAMRKPSFRGLEWLQYQRRCEVSPAGECSTRNKRCGIKDYFLEPLENYCCRPCPYPKTTYGEIGWLGQHDSCKLEIYPNDFMKKPPLPWHYKPPSSFPIV